MEISHDDFPVPAPEMEARNRKIVKALYKALRYDNREAVAMIVANDIEWWYHGPPHCQHMMRMLTGKSRHMEEFKFKPRSITAVGEVRVIVEGWEGLNAYWVHVWTVKDGMITQFREYFNTWLTVLLRVSEVGVENRRLWQSKPRERPNRSLPDLLLAI